MKWLKLLLKALSFLCMYIVPIFLFSGVKPFIHGDISAGLTKVGYLAFVIAFIVCWIKLCRWVEKQPETVGGTVFLCITPLAVWVVVMLGVDHIADTVNSIINYWWRVLPFILAGCALKIFASALKEEKE